jgi:hypothetical protein
MPKTFLNLPHGLEVLIIKAAVDPAFKALLLAHRADAAGEIGLTLTPTEAAMLAAIPAATLEATIAQTQVLPETRRVFLGKVAAAMLAALGVGTTGCSFLPPSDQELLDQIDPPEERVINLEEILEKARNRDLSDFRELEEKVELKDLKKEVEALAKQAHQQQLELNELKEQVEPLRPCKGILPDRPQPVASEKKNIPPVPDTPKPKAAQPATTATGEMVDLRTIVKFPKPLFGATPYRGPKTDQFGDEILRDGWDVSPNSKRK